MQEQLVAANAQIMALGQMVEAMRTDQERLRRDSEAAFVELQRSAGLAGQAPKPPSRLSFVNQKHYEGGKFTGKKDENYKAWAKRVRVYVSCCPFLS